MDKKIFLCIGMLLLSSGLYAMDIMDDWNIINSDGTVQPLLKTPEQKSIELKILDNYDSTTKVIEKIDVSSTKKIDTSTTNNIHNPVTNNTDTLSTSAVGFPVETEFISLGGFAVEVFKSIFCLNTYSLKDDSKID